MMVIKKLPITSRESESKWTTTAAILLETSSHIGYKVTTRFQPESRRVRKLILNLISSGSYANYHWYTSSLRGDRPPQVGSA